jgi:hypothetical protein
MRRRLPNRGPIKNSLIPPPIADHWPANLTARHAAGPQSTYRGPAPLRRESGSLFRRY